MWEPPEYPDPSVILHEAVDDGRKGRPEVALAKFLWFHKNATRYDFGLSGVRLSFALGYWLDLASRYPPAKEAFVRVRDAAEAAFRKDHSQFQRFHDVAAMNDCIGTGERTAAIFAEVAAKDYEAADRLYHVAEPYLVATGDFRTCAPFLHIEERSAFAARLYERHRQMDKANAERANAFAAPLERANTFPRLAKKSYVEDVATLAALLVLNDRPDDAREVYRQSLQVIDDGYFRAIMDAALAGHLPKRT